MSRHIILIDASNLPDLLKVAEVTSCPLGAPPSMKMGYTARGTEPGHTGRSLS